MFKSIISKIKKRYKSFDKRDLVPVFVILVFLVLTGQYWGDPPGLDNMVIFRETTMLFEDGLESITSYGYTLHPPLINIWIMLFFSLFGKNVISYNLAGFVIYLIANFAFWNVNKKKFGYKVAAIAQLLLFLNPYVILNSLHLSNDMLILTIFLSIFYAIGLKKRVLASIMFCFFSITKETGLVFVGSYILITLFRLIRKFIKEKTLDLSEIILIIPSVVCIAIWFYIRKVLNISEWREMNFGVNGENSFIVAFTKLFDFSSGETPPIVNNTKNLLLISWQWVYTLIAIVYILTNRDFSTLNKNKKKLYFQFFFVGLVLYWILALSFPTWTVSRYTLPIFPMLMLICAFALSKIKYKYAIRIILLLILLFNLNNWFFNNDFLTKKVYPGIEESCGAQFYAIPFSPNGPDRVIYNVNYLIANKNQNEYMREVVKTGADALSYRCWDMKLGEKFWSWSLKPHYYGFGYTKFDIACLEKEFSDYDKYIMSKKKNILMRSGWPDEVYTNLKEIGITDDQILRMP